MAAAMAVAGPKAWPAVCAPWIMAWLRFMRWAQAGGPDRVDLDLRTRRARPARCRQRSLRSMSRRWRRNWTGRRRRSSPHGARGLGLAARRIGRGGGRSAPRAPHRRALPRRPTRRTGRLRQGCRRRMHRRPSPPRRAPRRPCRTRRPSLPFRPGRAPPAPAIAVPATARPVPTAAPAPSCGAPETRPVAMPGPKMPRPSMASAASTTESACSIVGWPPA